MNHISNIFAILVQACCQTIEYKLLNQNIFIIYDLLIFILYIQNRNWTKPVVGKNVNIRLKNKWQHLKKMSIVLILLHCVAALTAETNGKKLLAGVCHAWIWITYLWLEKISYYLSEIKLFFCRFDCFA